MPPAARLGDDHKCPLPGPPKHKGGPIKKGDTTVIVAGKPQARIGDPAKCIPATDTIAQGEPTVLVGGRPAARKGDKTAHGGKITKGAEKVLIGKGGGGGGGKTKPPNLKPQQAKMDTATNPPARKLGPTPLTPAQRFALELNKFASKWAKFWIGANIDVANKVLDKKLHIKIPPHILKPAKIGVELLIDWYHDASYIHLTDDKTSPGNLNLPKTAAKKPFSELAKWIVEDLYGKKLKL